MFLVCVKDCTGTSQIASIMLLPDETEDTIVEALDTVKAFTGPAWKPLVCIIDCCQAEENAVRHCFSGIEVLYCVFHVKKAIERHFRSVGISESDEVKRLMNRFDCVMKAECGQSFAALRREFLSDTTLKTQNLKKYFEDHWFHEKFVSMWAFYLRRFPHLSSETNNPIETVNNALKTRLLTKLGLRYDALLARLLGPVSIHYRTQYILENTKSYEWLVRGAPASQDFKDMGREYFMITQKYREAWAHMLQRARYMVKHDCIELCAPTSTPQQPIVPNRTVKVRKTDSELKDIDALWIKLKPADRNMLIKEYVINMNEPSCICYPYASTHQICSHIYSGLLFLHLKWSDLPPRIKNNPQFTIDMELITKLNHSVAASTSTMPGHASRVSTFTPNTSAPIYLTGGQTPIPSDTTTPPTSTEGTPCSRSAVHKRFSALRQQLDTQRSGLHDLESCRKLSNSDLQELEDLSQAFSDAIMKFSDKYSANATLPAPKRNKRDGLTGASLRDVIQSENRGLTWGSLKRSAPTSKPEVPLVDSASAAESTRDKLAITGLL